MFSYKYLCRNTVDFRPGVVRDLFLTTQYGINSTSAYLIVINGI